MEAFVIYYTCRYRYGFTRQQSETREEAENEAMKRLPNTGLTCKDRCNQCRLKIIK